MIVINHGTTAGYYAHRRLSESACDACKEAVNEYLRKYRASKKGGRVRVRDQIRRRALALLRDRHREEYEDLLREVEDELIAESESWFSEQEEQ